MSETTETTETTETREPTETECVLAEMFTENTGTHFLDSGGAYGRAWQQNAGRDAASFIAEPVAVFDVYASDEHPDRGYVGVDVSAFHWCAEVFTYDAARDAMWRAWCEVEDADNDRAWLELAETFARDVMHGGGIYGDSSGPVVCNTYNDENNLSQTLQFVYWSDDDGDEYALLQVHGGCDVRGGYTAPRLFTCSVEGDPIGVFDYGRAGIYAGDDAPESDTAPFPGMPPRLSTAHAWEMGGYSAGSFYPYNGDDGYTETTWQRNDDGKYVKGPDPRPAVLPLDEYVVVESDDETLRGVVRVVRNTDAAGIVTSGWRVFSPVNGAEMFPTLY